MNIKEIPLMVYKQMCSDFCEEQEEIIVYLDGRPWRIKRERQGFVFGYREEAESKVRERNSFAIWNAGSGEIPAETKLREHETAHILLKITAGSFSTGVWLYGQGEVMEERIEVGDLPCFGFRLGSKIVEIMCQAISEANILAMSPECEKETFYESDKQPGEYHEPSI